MGNAFSPPQRRWCIPSILLAITLVASPLFIGGVHGVLASTLAILCIVGLWWKLGLKENSAGQTRQVVLSIPTLFFAFMGLICLLQLVPVPRFLYKLFQPQGWAHLQTTWEVAFGKAPPGGWHLLSLDPRATSEQALRWFALSAASGLSAQLVVRRGGRRRWLGMVMISGSIVALAGLVQVISGTTKILGIYEADLTARSIGPFVNTNHAACFYGLIAMVGVAYASDHLRRSRIKVVFGAAVATAGVLLCAAHGSDAALGALALGLAILGVSALIRSRPGDVLSKKWLTRAAMASLFVLALASLFIPDHWTVTSEEEFLQSTSADARVAMTKAALDAVPSYGLVGSGAGSVDQVLPPFIDWQRFGNMMVPTIENEPVEWALTMGPLIPLFALALFAFMLARTGPHIAKKRGRRGASYAFALLIYLGFISLFHFPFQVLGVSLVAAVAIEACLDNWRLGVHFRRPLWKGRLFAAALTAAVLGLIGARATLLSEGPEETLEVDDEAALQRALRLYPTDGVLISAMSLQARTDGDHQASLRLARRAFELRPHPRQEYLLARALAFAGHQEEAAEVYRSILDQERRSIGLWGQIRPRLLYDLPGASLRARALSQASAAHRRQIAQSIRRDEGGIPAIEFALALTAERPDDPAAHLLLIELYTQEKQFELAEFAARTLIARGLFVDDEEEPAGLRALLDILERQDRRPEAMALAERAFAAGYDSQAMAMAALALRPSDPAELAEPERPVLVYAAELGCQPPYENRSQQRRCWEARAYLAEAEGDLEQAQGLLRRVERQYGDPRPLAAFFARQRLCQDLAGLQRAYRGENHESTLKRRAQECAR